MSEAFMRHLEAGDVSGMWEGAGPVLRVSQA